jgi:hypothetical protein
MRSINLNLILALTVVLLGTPGPSLDAASRNAPSLVVISPGASGVTLAEMDEFATTVMGDPWDMDEPTDLAFYRTESQIFNSQFSDGVYSGQMTVGNGSERITLLTAGAANNAALRVGKIGYTYPIDADYYRYLSFRMYSSNTTCNSGLIQWYADDSYSDTSMGVSNGFLVPPSPCFGQPSGWYIYVLDLQTIGIQLGSQNWTSSIRELLIHPFSGTGAAGATVKLDWARLTADDPNTARPYTIEWTGDGSGGPVTLYASPDDKVLDADDIVVAEYQSASDSSYTFQTGVLPAGIYYIAASNSNGTAWSSGPLIINAPPAVTIVQPSMTSGQEYATSEIGNAWDMNDTTDLNDSVPPSLYTCVTNESYSNGIYSAVIPSPVCPSGSSGSDSILYLGGMDRYPPGTLDPLIDTSKYRYLSYRFYHSGTQDVGHGWVTRFGWWQVNATDNGVNESPVMSRDIIILEDWNTYKIDLWAVDIVDETYPPGTPDWESSHPNRLRFDPTELVSEYVPATIQLDWIKLTAMNEVEQGDPFEIQYTLDTMDNVTATVYYDTDTDPTNGRTPIQLPAPGPAPSPTLTNTVYLPLVVNNLVSDSQIVVMWDTTGVTPGTYWISINADDGYNTTTWYSEAPVSVLSSTSARSSEWKRKYLLNLPL